MVARTFHFDVTQPVRTIKCGCGPTNYHFRTRYVRVALTRSPRWQAGRFGEGALWPPSHRLCLGDACSWSLLFVPCASDILVMTLVHLRQVSQHSTMTSV